MGRRPTLEMIANMPDAIAAETPSNSAAHAAICSMSRCYGPADAASDRARRSFPFVPPLTAESGGCGLREIWAFGRDFPAWNRAGGRSSS
jgi:hypothetical protein